MPLIAFDNSLYPDQANLNPNCLALGIFLEEFFKSLILKNINSGQKFSSMQRVKGHNFFQPQHKKNAIYTEKKVRGVGS